MITGDNDAIMSYTKYTRDIQLRYRVTLTGWTHHQWANPSDLSNSLGPLQKLRIALKEGKCHFVHLSDAQFEKIKEEYEAKLKSGDIPARKERSDIGVPRKKGGKAAKSTAKGMASSSRSAKRRRVDDDNSGNESDTESSDDDE